MSTYENVTFGNLNAKRQAVVRERIAHLWSEGYTTEAIAKRVKVGKRSVATAIGNLVRSHVHLRAKPVARKTTSVKTSTRKTSKVTTSKRTTR